MFRKETEARVMMFLVAVVFIPTISAQSLMRSQKEAGRAHAAQGFYGCLSTNATKLPYCNTSLSAADRVADVLSRLTLSQKISLLSPTDAPHYCACLTAAVPSVGLPQYKWLTEVNSVAQAAGNPVCRGRERCPTIFVGPNNVAASFNRSSWWHKGDVISDDIRAIFNTGGAPGDVSSHGLTGFGPNINLVKDPRYGRNSELPGEDPLLSGTYAAHYVQGMQQTAPGKLSGRPQLKMLAYLKHYTAYSVEKNRFTFSSNVSNFTLWDSNLPQFKQGFGAGASGAMCSYFAPNGVSSCGNSWLLNGLIRGAWNRPDAVVMSDCSAVGNMMKNAMHLDKHHASAQAMNAGLDIYGGWGDHLWTQGYLEQAANMGLTSDGTISKSVARTLMQKMAVGLFDDPADSPWARLDANTLNSSKAQGVALDIALQGMVLLKNDDSTLPLAQGARIAVLGPLGNDALALVSDYAKQGPVANDATIYQQLAAANVGGTTVFEKGVDVDSLDSSGIASALHAVGAADAVVLALGITRAQEHEGIDRQDTDLPGLQEHFALQVAASAAGKKPLVLVLCNGGSLSFDALLAPVPAIVEAFNPAGQGAKALAMLILGKANRWGKLPITLYPKGYAEQTSITDMEFHTPPGRSYRYYTGSPLFSFGHGLSLTSFQHSCVCDPLGGQHINCDCIVFNVGSRAGDEVVMVFHRVADDVRKAVGDKHPVPLKRLADFERVSLQPGGNHTLAFKIPIEKFGISNQEGESIVYPGNHELIFSRGTGNETVVQVHLADVAGALRAATGAVYV